MTHTSGSLGRGLTLLITAVVVVSALDAAPASSREADTVPLSPCYSSDNGSPVVTRVSVDHPVVDVRHHAQTLHVYVDAHDTGGPGPRTGIAGGSVALEDDDAVFFHHRLVHQGGGRWVATFRFAENAPSDTWYFYISLHDRADNSGGLSYSQLRGKGWPNSVTVRSDRRFISAAVRGLTFRPRVVDTRRAAVVVPVRARVSSSSRVARVRLIAEEAHGDRRVVATLARARGKAGVLFHGRLVIPRWQSRGMWRLSVQAVFPPWASTFGPSYLAKHHLRHRFRVLSRTDERAPKLVSLTATPSPLDVEAAPGSVHYASAVFDRKSGVSRIRVELERWNFHITTELSRTGRAGATSTWSGAGRITPCHSVSGTWKGRVTIWDTAGNRRSYRSSSLAALGWPGVEVVAGDHRAPQFSAVRNRKDPMVVTFSEDVVGISTESVHVYRGSQMINDFLWSDPSRPRPGTWSCVDGIGTVVDCVTGPVRTATFTPSTDKRFNEIMLNPDHQLAVRDLAGNPYDHEVRSVR
jgi:hypothetical protein